MQTTPTAWDVIQQIATFLVALTVLYAALGRPLIRRLTRNFREQVERIMSSQQETRAEVDQVRRQVYPNGGGSAHDYARQAAEGVSELRIGMAALRQEVTEVRDRQHSLAAEVVAHGHRLELMADNSRLTNRNVDALGRRVDILTERVERVTT